MINCDWVQSTRQRLACACLLFACTTMAHGQVLRDINYSYIYNPLDNYRLTWKITNVNNQIDLYYELESSLFGDQPDAYTIEWEVRKELSEEAGKIVGAKGADKPVGQVIRGSLRLDSSMAGQLAVAKVYGSQKDNKKTLTVYYKAIPASVTPALFQYDRPVVRTYIQKNSTAAVSGFADASPLVVSFYKTDFPAAAPPFSTAQSRVQPLLKPDSMFTISPEEALSLPMKGLYLIQSDTASSTGLAFRVEDDYPKHAKIETLAGPMIYLCTKQEYERLMAAGSDKSQFDKVILSITGSTDRARTFMRNYFRRVELANTYFSSYKEGWKTDRGMIYIIYGPPQEVYLVGDREVWGYKNVYYTGQFTFVKSSSVFDPENYVLIRDKNFADTWYQMIDLWRKARF
jgi:GWxTD domain-containing protein